MANIVVSGPTGWALPSAGFSNPSYIASPGGVAAQSASLGFDLGSAAALAIAFEGTYSGQTVVHQQTMDPAGLTGWFSVCGVEADTPSNTGTGVSTSGRCYLFPVVGVRARILVTALASGTIVARINATSSSGLPLTTGSSGGGGSGGTSSNYASTFPTAGTAVGFLDTSGNMSAGLLDAAGFLKVNVAAGSSGNAAASATGAAVPASAGYTGFNSGGNLVGVSSANPMPVVQTGTPGLPTGAATSALQTTGNGSLSTLAGAISGGKMLVDGSGVTQPISAVSLPLPTGAATAAGLTTINTTLGSPFQAGGSIGNSSFGISGTLPAFAATPTVNLGTIGTAATAAKQPAIGTAGSASADVITVQGRASMTPLDVNVVSGGGTGGTSSNFGSAFPTPGTAIGFKDSAGTNMAAGNLDASGNLKVNLAAGTISAAAPFIPVAQANLSVTSSTGRVALPSADQVVILVNTGSNDLYFKLGNSSVTAATTDIYLGAGRAISISANSNTNVAAITASSTTTLQVTTGTGTPVIAGGGGGSGGGGGAVTIADGADVTQGAVADAAASAGGAGTVSAKLRLATTQLAAINTALGSPFQAGGSIGNTTFASTQSGTWNITNISGTVSLPTGAATAAKQPALGTAGSSSTDVLSVQGIAAGTPLIIAPTIANPSSVLTRPANTTAYSAGDLIASNTTAGSIVVPSFTATRIAAGAFTMSRFVLSTNVTTGWGSVNLVVSFYTAAPTYSAGDNGAYAVATGAAGYLGSANVTLTQAGDGAVGSALIADGPISRKLASGSSVFWDIETLTAATPISGQTFTLTAEVVQA